MTQQELLRIYSMYLPYGLRFNAEDKVWELTSINFIDPNYQIWANNYWNEEKLKFYPEINVKDNSIGRGFSVNEVKPILRSLSDLTKDIEHEGERFVPIEKILEEYCFNLEKMDKKEIESYALSFIEIDMPFKVAELLFKWHFDIEDLISKGLAVNKNEIK